jgi:hypothetical protein
MVMINRFRACTGSPDKRMSVGWIINILRFFLGGDMADSL